MGVAALQASANTRRPAAMSRFSKRTVASDEASFVTGAVIPADGGFTAGKGH
jgi:hypothetical protein